MATTIEKVWELNGIGLAKKTSEGGVVWAWHAMARVGLVVVVVPADSADKALAGLRDALECVNIVRLWKAADEWAEQEDKP